MNQARIDQIHKLLQDNPGDSFLNHALALEHMKVGDEDGARDLFEQLLSRDPGYVGSYYQLARIYEKQGERQKAVDTYEKGIGEAAKAGDDLSLRELRAALDELLFE